MTLDEALATMEARIEAALPEAMRTAAETVAAEARAEHPYTDRSGTLTASITAGGVHTEGEHVVAEVVAEADYASYVAEGSAHREGRPFLEPAHARCAGALADAVTEHLAGSLT
mgnify:CR=1 FL=1